MTTKDEIMLILERYDVDPKTHNVIADKILALRQREQSVCDCVTGYEGDTPITFEMCEKCKSKI